MTVIKRSFSAYTAALDSGCSSHTVKRSSLPMGSIIDRTQPTNIQTASSGIMLPSFGKSSNGLLHNALVVDDDLLTKNLISIAKLSSWLHNYFQKRPRCCIG